MVANILARFSLLSDAMSFALGPLMEALERRRRNARFLPEHVDLGCSRRCRGLVRPVRPLWQRVCPRAVVHQQCIAELDLGCHSWYCFLP